MAPPLSLTGWLPAWGPRGLGTRLRGLAPWRRRGTVTAAVTLPDGRAWSCRVGPGGATVRCAAGAVLLTREGDPEDRILAAGDSFRSDRPGRLALLALSPADLAISGELRGR